ncbi:MAG: saccharopine dehydrogenase [Cytophagales bacterium]|nr:saccharopine dehydrogenase [Cytophagales bacterium]
MQKILVLGAGRSATSLIAYLHQNAAADNWQITIAEKDIELAREKTSRFEEARLISFDIENEDQVHQEISEADLVVSMLPARFHIVPARKCAELGKNMVTASYLTNDIKELSSEFEAKGAQCIMELGLDPGIDHMSAMKVLDRLRKEGNELTAFETFTGGLLREDKENDNPWKYKFTWNPRNVVLAGQGYVKFIQEGRYKYIPYNRLFQRTEVIHIPGHGYFEGYANRDSLNYLDLYNLRGINTLYRGTLRRPGYCKAWDVFIQLGATEDTYELENVNEMTHRQFINSFLQYNPGDSVELKLAHYLNIGMESAEMYKLKWLDLFSDELIGLEKGTPAQILEHILKKKWTLNEEDRDLIVMWHKFDYIEKGQPKQIQSSMVVEGEDQTNTAMSKTVGLPLAMAAKHVLSGRINKPGVHIPTHKEIYEPILEELNEIGFEFREIEVDLDDQSIKA